MQSPIPATPLPSLLAEPHQALAAERVIGEGRTDSDILPIDETVAIMETLDEVRELVGVRYPQED